MNSERRGKGYSIVEWCKMVILGKAASFGSKDRLKLAPVVTKDNPMSFVFRRIPLQFIVIITLFISTFAFSCKKSGPAEAVITVLDSLNKPVAGAAVTLWQDTSVNQTNGVKSNVRITKTSDGSGKAYFSFELESYLNIDVVFHGDTARSFIRLKEHESVEKTVVI